MKKKMCHWYKRAACSVDQTEYNYEKYKYVRHDCPKNVNDKCEIKEREVTLEALVYKPMLLGPKSTTGKVTDITTQDMFGFEAWKPCKIVMTDANYKRLKGTK